MENRVKKIYQEIYTLPRSKEYFAKLFEVSTKTIENTVNKYKNDIVYDKKLGRYRFINLLPRYISYETFLKLFQTSIENDAIKSDFFIIAKSIAQIETSFTMIDTSILSDLVQKIILCDIALNHNCILQIDYAGNKRAKEAKYIQPHTIISTGYTYYLYCSYDEKNEKNVGEYRSLAFNGMGKITPYIYLKDGNFRIDKPGNAYGLFKQEDFVTLKLESTSAKYFTREGFFKKNNFDFIEMEEDGSIIIKMYYNHEQEIISLIQQWMPQISIHDNIRLKEKIYSKIISNTRGLTNI